MNGYRIPGFDHAALQNNGHNAGLSNQIPLFVFTQNGLHEPGLKSIQLNAGIPQSGDFYKCSFADL